MKRIVGIALVFSALLIGCNSSDKGSNEAEKKEKKESLPLEVYENGVYTEWYPGRKQIKVRGRQTKDGKKEGVWRSYSPDGYEMSIIVFKEGKKQGHIVVYYPNGVVHYSGEYDAGERVGAWKFYNEQGALVKEENYDTE